MKAAIIGAGAEALHTIKKAHEYGITVTALDGDPGAAGLRAADKMAVVDISDEGAVIEALWKDKPDFVLTVPIGRYLTTTGAANDALNLPGIDRQMAVLCTDKGAVHKKLFDKGLRNCQCYALRARMLADVKGNTFSVEEAGGKIPLSFPAILKPRYGSGSRGIHVLSDGKELKEAAEIVSGEDYVLEECVSGEEYGIDGAVLEDGFHMVLLRRKKNTPFPARQAVGYFSVLPEDEFYQAAGDYMRDVIRCLGLKECLIHGDIMKTDAGPFVIELSARPSGHYLHDLFTPLCTGVDPAEEYIKYRLGLSCSFTPRRVQSMLIHYFDMQGKIRRIPSREQVEQAIDARLEAWRCSLEAGEELAPVSDGHSVMSRGYFVLTGGDDMWLERQAETVKSLFVV